jgi:hypothetical protein
MSQPGSSKGHDKKRKAYHFVNTVEWPWRHKEYQPRSGEFEGFLDRICIFHPRESTRPSTVTDSKVSQIWNGSRGLHPSMFFRNFLIRLSQSHLALDQSQETLRQVIPSRAKHLTTSPR